MELNLLKESCQHPAGTTLWRLGNVGFELQEEPEQGELWEVQEEV